MIILLCYAMSWTMCTAQSEEDGKQYLKDIDPLNSQWTNKVGNADWDYDSNITDANLANEVRYAD